MLRPQPMGPVPEDTARVTQALFPNGHPYLRLADEVGDLFTPRHDFGDTSVLFALARKWPGNSGGHTCNACFDPRNLANADRTDT
jgi:hypothetical protein